MSRLLGTESKEGIQSNLRSSQKLNHCREKEVWFMNSSLSAVTSKGIQSERRLYAAIICVWRIQERKEATDSSSQKFLLRLNRQGSTWIMCSLRSASQRVRRLWEEERAIAAARRKLRRSLVRARSLSAEGEAVKEKGGAYNPYR